MEKVYGKQSEQKALVRNQIITASNVYSNGLAGKMFLYVFGNEFFEVVFKTDRFMHLTGVNSILNAQSFYNMARSSKLTTTQFYFDSQHSFTSAKTNYSAYLCFPPLPIVLYAL